LNKILLLILILIVSAPVYGQGRRGGWRQGKVSYTTYRDQPYLRGTPVAGTGNVYVVGKDIFFIDEDGTVSSLLGGAGGVVWINKAANYTAVSGEGILVDTDTGAYEIKLPASPTVSDRVGIMDEDANAATNNITIGRNGSNIMGIAEDMTIDTNNGMCILVYSSDATEGWKLESAIAKGTEIVVTAIINGTTFLPEATVATTDATVTTLDTIAITDDYTYYITSVVKGQQDDGTDRAGYRIEAAIYRASAGSATIEGAVTGNTQESNAALAATFTVSGNNALVSVTGIAAENWKWTASTTYSRGTN
jgi:hypothetical protein